MSAVLHITDYLVIVLMLSISTAIGLYFRFTGGRQKTTEEFLMGGKNMPIWPVAFSIMATFISAITVVGLPAEVYLYGCQYIFTCVGYLIGFIFIAYGFLPVYFEMEVSSVYEYLEKRFGKTTRTVASLLFTLQTMFYLAGILYAPSVGLNVVTGLSTWTSVCTILIICTFYSSLGGLKAVLWADVFQSILMYVTIIAIVVKGSADVGGIRNVFDIAKEGGRLDFFNVSIDFTQRYTVWGSIFSGAIYSLFSFGSSQLQVQRMLSTGNLKKAQIAVIVSLPLNFLFLFFCYWTGIVIYSYFLDCDPLQNPLERINSPDQVVPHTIIKIFGHMSGLPGLCIAGVFSASLSTISSALNSLAAVTMEDFIRPFCFCKRLTEPWAAFLAKIVAITYGAGCLILTYIIANFRGVFEGTSVMVGTISGPMLGIFTLGMLTTAANEPVQVAWLSLMLIGCLDMLYFNQSSSKILGILIGLLFSFVFGLWLGFGSLAAKVKVPSLHRSIESCPTAFNSSLSFNKNVSSVFNIRNTNSTDPVAVLNEQNRYIFPIYKVSYVWFPLFGFIAAILSGYVASLLIGIWKKYPPLHPINYSPFVRKWYFGSSKAPVVEKVQLDMFK